MKNKDLRISFILLLAGLFITIVSPYLLTRHGFIDFTQTGPIGDTIGGITSPITNLIGAILVFYALKAQIESNELTRKQFEQQRLDELDRKELLYLSNQIDIIRSEINDFNFVHEEVNNNIPGNPITYKGASAIERLVNIIPNTVSYFQEHDINPFSGFPLLMAIKILLLSIDSTLDKINKSNVSDIDKKHLISILSYQYSSKIKSAFEAKIKSYKMTYTFDLSGGQKSESVFTDELYNIVKSIDLKIVNL